MISINLTQYLHSILLKIVIWKKKDNTYYYRIYRHCFLNFDVGYHNSYGHEVVFIIDDLEFKRPIKRFSKEKFKKNLIKCINRL